MRPFLVRFSEQAWSGHLLSRAGFITSTSGYSLHTGMSRVRAGSFAEDWVARLRGALILQAATGDTGPFNRAMDVLLDLAKEGATHVQG